MMAVYEIPTVILAWTVYVTSVLIGRPVILVLLMHSLMPMEFVNVVMGSTSMRLQTHVCDVMRLVTPAMDPEFIVV
jgi:hypothetical protein